jgi:uncharacterized membrane protein YfcA
MRFPVAGIEVHPALPPLVAAALSFLTSMGGVSGALLLMPFQMSVLRFVGPAVTSTNHLFNVVAIPPGVLRLAREGRLLRPLALLIICGSFPGIVLGMFVRIYLLPRTEHFKVFVASVLLLIGVRLLLQFLRMPAGFGQYHRTRVESFDGRHLVYSFGDKRFGLSVPAVLLTSFAMGTVGGIYGLGGGSLMALCLVSFFELPVHTIGGATLSANWATSLIGVLAYSAVQPLVGGTRVAPDWLLGALLGGGGMVGIYCGARVQKHVPGRLILAMLCLLVLSVSAAYFYGTVFTP